MNPVLLKPESETGAQVIVRGQGASATMRAARIRTRGRRSCCRRCWRASRGSGRGHGSSSSSRGRAARPRSTSAPATSPTWASPRPPTCRWCMVGDIDRGGVIASLVGTHAVLPRPTSARIQGFVINKFRGDAGLFSQGHGADRGADGLAVARRGARGLRRRRGLPAEDSLGLDAAGRPRGRARMRHRGAGAAADRQLRRSRPARGRSRTCRW